MKNYKLIAIKITGTLFVAHSLSSVAFILSATIIAIVGAELSGDPTWAGVPSAVMQLGSAFAALVISAAMDRMGRRWALFLGMVGGTVGSIFAAQAIVVSSFLILLVGMALMGVARAAIQLARFTAAEVNTPQNRGLAISFVIIGGAVGSVLGPLLVGPAGRYSVQMGLNELVGPFLASIVVLVLSGLIIFTLLRPDPREIGREMNEMYPEPTILHDVTRSTSEILRSPGVFTAVSVMVLGQVIMVLVMGITSLHMKGHDHSLGDISTVFSAHTLGMFAFSIITGFLTDRWGRTPVILAGAGMLIVSCLMAPFVSGVFSLSIPLFLLGLGWNFCYVGGSALLSDHLSPVEKAKIQGTNDLLIGLSTAVISIASGFIFAGMGYTGVGMIGAFFSLVLLGLIGWWIIKSRVPMTAEYDFTQPA